MAENAEVLARGAFQAGFHISFQKSFGGIASGESCLPKPLNMYVKRLNPYSGVIMAVAIALAEGGSIGTCNPDGNGISCGPWQIHFTGAPSPANIADLIPNAKAAFKKSGGGNSWRMWSTAYGDHGASGYHFNKTYLKQGAAVFSTLPTAIQAVANTFPQGVDFDPKARECLVKDAIDRVNKDSKGQSSVGANIGHVADTVGGILGDTGHFLGALPQYLLIAGGALVLLVAIFLAARAAGSEVA